MLLLFDEPDLCELDDGDDDVDSDGGSRAATEAAEASGVIAFIIPVGWPIL